MVATHDTALEFRRRAVRFKRLVKFAAKSAGLNPEEIDAFSGHSLCVGAAQDLLCAGYDAADIMRAGGWKLINILGLYLEIAEHHVWA